MVLVTRSSDVVSRELGRKDGDKEKLDKTCSNSLTVHFF